MIRGFTCSQPIIRSWLDHVSSLDTSMCCVLIVVLFPAFILYNHSVPKDKLEEWSDATRKKLSPSSRVCSRHFLPSDYLPWCNLKLKDDATPSICCAVSWILLPPTMWSAFTHSQRHSKSCLDFLATSVRSLAMPNFYYYVISVPCNCHFLAYQYLTIPGTLDNSNCKSYLCSLFLRCKHWEYSC